jgi:hypothetical protein
MIPNIKSEGMEYGEKVIHAGSVYHVQRTNWYVYPFKSSIRGNCINCLDSVTERNNFQERIINELLASDLYITKKEPSFLVPALTLITTI